MIHKTPIPLTGTVIVTFELPSCLWATKVSVAGDFNGWNTTSTPMRQERDGVWRARVELAAGGRFQFRYLIDGQWQTDYHADGNVTNEYNTENSVVDLSIVLSERLRAPGVSDLVREGEANGASTRRKRQVAPEKRAA